MKKLSNLIHHFCDEFKIHHILNRDAASPVDALELLLEEPRVPALSTLGLGALGVLTGTDPDAAGEGGPQHRDSDWPSPSGTAELAEEGLQHASVSAVHGTLEVALGEISRCMLSSGSGRPAAQIFLRRGVYGSQPAVP